MIKLALWATGVRATEPSTIGQGRWGSYPLSPINPGGLPSSGVISPHFHPPREWAEALMVGQARGQRAAAGECALSQGTGSYHLHHPGSGLHSTLRKLCQENYTWKLWCGVFLGK